MIVPKNLKMAKKVGWKERVKEKTAAIKDILYWVAIMSVFLGVAVLFALNMGQLMAEVSKSLSILLLIGGLLLKTAFLGIVFLILIWYIFIYHPRRK